MQALVKEHEGDSHQGLREYRCAGPPCRQSGLAVAQGCWQAGSEAGGGEGSGDEEEEPAIEGGRGEEAERREIRQAATQACGTAGPERAGAGGASGQAIEATGEKAGATHPCPGSS